MPGDGGGELGGGGGAGLGGGLGAPVSEAALREQNEELRRKLDDMRAEAASRSPRGQCFGT